ncbi:type III-B CRISPR-associated protein Cas10/Cmr2 [Lyngbya confervoides]|uniref:Type III-B CRISPR-associated protein Cas10/Cmr2 n=1 Tax=Lyngbya confervoides BDU141951 TaxID=1574623 RepID=A0ABD4T3Z6_9CYAN|nr:type III-B CRISPR-associated protein Cas10/Cmr2 [Lyngbya confervoides]MCM1982962.1 type III-B CRISPR-associated protein Cas10/Cmr2 [Lyngbya confervoides BDU141951]
MVQPYWQAKIWGLLHDPVLKALHSNPGRGQNSFWKDFWVLRDWVDEDSNPETTQRKGFQQIHLADMIASASDRGAIGSLNSSVNYSDQGLQIRHLLSGEALELRLQPEFHQLSQGKNPTQTLFDLEKSLFEACLVDSAADSHQSTPIFDLKDERKVFWWLWRCLPEVVCQKFGADPSLLLMPAETRLPDGSIWSHTSMTAALAGALAGYDLSPEALQKWPHKQEPSRAYMTVFSFSPIQTLIKASRKMRDFWSGSWILHYLSAKVCWAIAMKYGPDTVLYPSLFQQPLIDAWIREQWPDFEPWVPKPAEAQLLTAGFPNVIVVVLPEDKVAAAMQMADQVLRQEWLKVGELVHGSLQERHWMTSLPLDHKSWKGWLQAQWQTYWSALPIGDRHSDLTSSEVYRAADKPWADRQNKTFKVKPKQVLFNQAEAEFLQQAGELRRQQQGKNPANANVGSWWPYVFDQLRLGLTSIKNARNWEIPTAFSVRSSLSGLGPAVHPQGDWISEGEVKAGWQRQAGLFDGTELLNATETVKRGLHKILPQLLPGYGEADFQTAYPDLTAGVAGYLKVHGAEHRQYFVDTCQEIRQQPWMSGSSFPASIQWGIPWMDQPVNSPLRNNTSRYLNAGWLLEDLELDALKALEDQLAQTRDADLIDLLQADIRQRRRDYRQRIQEILDRRYGDNNPADWYVLAAGDGDGMSEWLKGEKLKPYQNYLASSLNVEGKLKESFEKFITQPKRMGPATHNALSRALLDFSNQLVPYLTEQRYAGRLIYGGGDDVLAYSNLWEWDSWLWDLRQCFKGQPDPLGEFDHQGDYWRWQVPNRQPSGIAQRPLFTMGSAATISFGLVIVNQAVPLAIALENLWEAEAEAKAHRGEAQDPKTAKDAVQVRVLFGNGNCLKATCKFSVFDQWRGLLGAPASLGEWIPNLQAGDFAACFEQMAELWGAHPVPTQSAIACWLKAFINRRDLFKNQESARTAMLNLCQGWLEELWRQTDPQDRQTAVQAWLKLTAFILRKRDIKLKGH